MKYKLVFAVMALVAAFGAFAKDQQVTMNGKHILVTDVSNDDFKTDKIHSNDLNTKEGVYVFIGNEVQPSQPAYPNAAKVIAEVLKENGITVATTMDNASFVFGFGTLGALDYAKAEQAAAYSTGPNAGQVIATSGQLAGSIANSVHTAAGGAGGLIGFVAGALFNTDTKLVATGIFYKDPVIAKVGLFGVKGLASKSNVIIHNTASIFYKLEKGKEASDDVVLKMAADQWIKHYVVFDTPIAPTQQAPAPAATPVAPVAEVPAPAVTSVSAASLPHATEEKK